MTERQPPYTPKQLTEWAEEHLRHELVQCTAVAILQARDDLVTATTETMPWVNNALLESFLLHARAIDDFLGLDHRGKNPDNDVLAVDYLTSWKPQRALATQDRQGINRQLAHVSILRVSGPERPWHFIEISDQLLLGMARFLSAFMDAPESDRRIASTDPLEIGWQQSIHLLTEYGLRTDP